MKCARYYNFLISFIALAALLWLLAAQAQAGGWAVITLDHLPETPTANQPFEVSFMVRQHGVRPMESLTPQVTATHVDSGETVEVTADAQADVGHYLATLTLPHAGKWHWSIQAFTMDSAMPDLDVWVEASPRTTSLGSPFGPIGMGVIGLVGMVGSTVLWWRKRVWWTSLLALTAGTIGTMGIVMTVNQNVAEAEPPPLADETELGDRLFVAKGCFTCHYHDSIETDNPSLHTGPNLTTFTTSPEYLRLWLKNPAAVKPNTLMPNLNLSDAEIEALIPLFAPTPAQALKK
ncbi:MAG: hypothetical protein KDJ65_36715 [Anaerolineae bacterium]|nr:hypothetical protein [Anaerolineae bacterium]